MKWKFRHVDKVLDGDLMKWLPPPPPPSPSTISPGHCHCFVNACSSSFPKFQNTVDKLVQRANASLLIGTSSWKEQFIDALTVSAGRLTTTNCMISDS